MKSLHRVVRRGVHQGLDLGEGWERGVCFSIVEVRVERAEENQGASCLGEGLSGGEGQPLETALESPPLGQVGFKHL